MPEHPRPIIDGAAREDAPTVLTLEEAVNHENPTLVPAEVDELGGEGGQDVESREAIGELIEQKQEDIKDAKKKVLGSVDTQLARMSSDNNRFFEDVQRSQRAIGRKTIGLVDVFSSGSFRKPKVVNNLRRMEMILKKMPNEVNFMMSGAGELTNLVRNPDVDLDQVIERQKSLQQQMEETASQLKKRTNDAMAVAHSTLKDFARMQTEFLPQIALDQGRKHARQVMEISEQVQASLSSQAEDMRSLNHELENASRELAWKRDEIDELSAKGSSA